MWTKLTHLVKHRSDESAREEASVEPRETQDGHGLYVTPSNASVMSRIYEIHPHLSVFREGEPTENGTGSPPSSPTKSSKRSVFRRSLKARLGLTPSQDAHQDSSTHDPMKGSSKKARASLQVDTFLAQSTPAKEIAPAPHSAPLPPAPQTPQLDGNHPNDFFDPSVEVQPTGTGSIRSILRDRNTPATGRSVRFFSRDAYRVISPEVSVDVDENAIPNTNSQTFMEKLKQSNFVQGPDDSLGHSTAYHSTLMSPAVIEDNMFSPLPPNPKTRKPIPFQPRHPPRSRNVSVGSSHSAHSRTDSLSFASPSSSSSLIIPNLGDMPNLIDTSQANTGDIPSSIEGNLQENSIKEETEGDVKWELDASNDPNMKTIRRTSGPNVTSTPNPSRSSNPRAILSPDGNVFHSMTNTDARPQCRSFLDGSNPSSKTEFFTPDVSKPNGTIYFTPEVGKSPFPEMSASMAPSKIIPEPSLPPNVEKYTHDELVSVLYQQLSIQNELASQFEVDLAARDELVTILSTQLQNSEGTLVKYRREVEKRQAAMRALRRKVADLEKLCRGLEEEVERSREESFDRSVMDEASEGALVVLHGSIGQLKGELEKVREEGVQERESMKKEIQNLSAERDALLEKEKAFQVSLEDQKVEMEHLRSELSEASEAQDTVVSLRQQLEEKESRLEDEREHFRLKEEGWEADRNDLEVRLEAARSEHVAYDGNVDGLQQAINEKDEELRILREELEAQWTNVEKADERIKSLEGEKEGLTKSVQALDAKVEELGAQWREAEAKRTELEEELNEAWAIKEELEQERDHLVDDVNFERENAERLTHTIQEHEVKLEEVERERQYAMDNITRLEELLHKGDMEIAVSQTRIIESEREAEDLRGQMSKIAREHNRLLDERMRDTEDLTQRESSALRRAEEAVKQKAENDVKLLSMEGEKRLWKDELERLKRQVHDLQQESADKEVKILQLSKARAQDKEDKEGLNIALDSKQQELELLKRRLGVKGTGGATPAVSRIGLPERRQSSTFATPSAPRPRPRSTTGVPKPVVAETPDKLANLSKSTVRPPTSTVKANRMPSVPRGTPLSASTSSLARSTSGLAQSTSTNRSRSSIPSKSAVRNRSSSVLSSSTVSYGESEKENSAPTKGSAKRGVLVAA